MTNDGFHTYTYDADGNITGVDGGSTAQYKYNALNQRIRTIVGSNSTEFVFNQSGQRVSTWNGTTKAQIKGQYYWGSKPVAYYTTSPSAAHFQHQDWLGTERLRTTYTGAVEASLTSLPFGDAQTTETGGDANYFASLDYDSETSTDHAQFRQYSSTQGHWMSPDPYSGSYDVSNPQSMNRYVYAANSPQANVDPKGLVIVENALPPWLQGIIDGGGIDGNQPAYGIGGFGSNWDEFQTVYNVNAGNGTYSYTDDVWDDTMSGGYGGGNTAGSDGQIQCSDGSTCGYVWQSMVGMNFSTSQIPTGNVSIPEASSNDMEYDIFHCPSCVNTWKQSNCVVNKPFNTVKDDLVAGIAGAGLYGAVAASGSGIRNLGEGAVETIGKEALGPLAIATTYAHAISATAYALAEGCNDD